MKTTITPILIILLFTYTACVSKHTPDINISKEILREELSEKGSNIDMDTIAVVNMLRPYKTETLFRSIQMKNTGNTDHDGIVSEVIEINTLKKLTSLSNTIIAGKIVFINGLSDPNMVQIDRLGQFESNRTVYGTNIAALKGAIGVIIRSDNKNNPERFIATFDSKDIAIPALSISGDDADLLHFYLESEVVQIYINYP